MEAEICIFNFQSEMPRAVQLDLKVVRENISWWCSAHVITQERVCAELLIGWSRFDELTLTDSQGQCIDMAGIRVGIQLLTPGREGGLITIKTNYPT